MIATRTRQRRHAQRVLAAAVFALVAALCSAQSLAAPAPVEPPKAVLDVDNDATPAPKLTAAEVLAIALGERGTVKEVERPTAAAVPLPAAAWLFGSAIFGFIFLANRKRV